MRTYSYASWAHTRTCTWCLLPKRLLAVLRVRVESLLLPPPFSRSDVSLMLAWGWLRGYSRWASQALLSSFSPVLSCTVLVLAFALPQWDLAPLASFLCRFAPLFAERMRKRPHARETHRILSHPILNYIKVHLTPTKCSCFLSPLWLCLTHSLFLSAVLFCANKGKRKKRASDQLSRSSTPLVTGNDLSMSMSYRLISPYFDTRQPKRLAGTAPGS